MLEYNIFDDPMEPMDPLDPPPSDPPNRKRPLWLHDTLQNAKRNVPIHRSFRERKKPCRNEGYIETMSTMIQVGPSSFEEVVKCQVWKDSMAEEYESILKNDVQDVLPRPNGKSSMTSKWIFKIKHGIDGDVEKYIARFVYQGLPKKEGEDYDDIFSHVARYITICLIVSLISSQGWTLHDMDIKTTFLHGMLYEEVYVEKP